MVPSLVVPSLVMPSLVVLSLVVPSLVVLSLVIPFLVVLSSSILLRNLLCYFLTRVSDAVPIDTLKKFIVSLPLVS